MNSVFYKTLIILGFGMTGATAYAQTDFTDGKYDGMTAADVTAAPSAAMPEKWTFSDCVDWATANSTDIRQSILSILQADENIGAAKDAWLPSVGFSMNHSFTNYPNPEKKRTGNIYGSSYGVNASWTIWEGNVRKYRLESANYQTI